MINFEEVHISIGWYQGIIITPWYEINTTLHAIYTIITIIRMLSYITYFLLYQKNDGRDAFIIAETNTKSEAF